jgi:hypothetical protein
MSRAIQSGATESRHTFGVDRKFRPSHTTSSGATPTPSHAILSDVTRLKLSVRTESVVRLGSHAMHGVYT